MYDESHLEILRKIHKIHTAWNKLSPESISRHLFELKDLEQRLDREKHESQLGSIERSHLQARDQNESLERPSESVVSETTDTNASEFSILAASTPAKKRTDIQASDPTATNHPESPEDAFLGSNTPSTSPIENEAHRPLRRRPIALQSTAQATEDITVYLSAIQIYVAKELGLITGFPEYDERKIKAMSRGKPLVKSYTLAQVGYFLQLMVTRLAKGLLISLLETAVLSFCLCCCLAYCFYWSKPQSVDVPEKLEIDQPRPALPRDIILLKCFGPIGFIRTTLCRPFVTDTTESTKPIPNDAMDGVLFCTGGIPTHYAEFAAVLAGAAFGALYFLAWSFPFPTAVEAIIWRISAGMTVAGPILYDIANLLLTKFFRNRPHHWAGLWGIAALYLFARGFLIVEMFRTLFFLPPATFAV